MTTLAFRPYSDDQIDIRELERMGERTEQQDRSNTTASFVQGSFGLITSPRLINNSDVQFPVKITGEASGAYAWTEQYRSAPGVFADLTGGRSGTTTDDPAREIN